MVGSKTRVRARENKAPAKKPTRCFVYVLGSRRKNDRRTYVGWTTDLKRRLAQHNAGRGAKSTRGRTWVLLYSECCETHSGAMSREWHIKRDRKFRAKLRAALSTGKTGAAGKD